jgi:NADH-quinone oxidoreductase subunit N
MTLPTVNLIAILPELILVAAALLVVMLDLLGAGKRALGWFSLAAVLIALAAGLAVTPANPALQTMALADGLGRIMGAAVLIAAGLACLISIERVGDFTGRGGAFFAMLLLATTGMRVMTIANDFMTLFISLEILSLALYILVGFNRKDPRSAEAALKYFLLGAFASAFFLYGVALIYAATGTTNLTEIARGILPLSAPLPGAPLLPIGAGLLIVGFGFKLALVPFHMWTPDAYQGAPTPVTAFMSVATKTAAFAALIRVLSALTTHDKPWLLALAVLAALTMTLGNLAALRQNSLKRMLAYSSIAHAGYVLIGLASGTAQGTQGALYYLLAYTFMNIGAFSVVLALQRRDENDVQMERLTGLAARRPGLALLMAIFMFSLTGVPPLAGFFAKLYVFGAAVNGGLIWLVIIGGLNSAVSAYYYLRVIVSMYMAEPAIEQAPITVIPITRVPIKGAAARASALTAGLARGTRAPVLVAAGQAPAIVAPAGVAAAIPSATRAPSGAGAVTPWPIWVALVVTAIGTVGLGLWQFPWMESITQAVAMLAGH